MAFEKVKSSNPAGRPAGARNKTTRMLEALLDGELSAIGRKILHCPFKDAPIFENDLRHVLMLRQKPKTI